MAVAGGTTITFGDRLLARWTSGTKLMLVLLAAVVVATTFESFRQLPPEPFGWAFMVLAGLVTTLAILGLWLALVAATVAITGLRMSVDQRRISYELDEAGVATRDGTGASLTCPWTNVRKARETSRAIRLSLKPMGSRYIPKRAFEANDLPALRALLREKLGAAAKLRGG